MKKITANSTFHKMLKTGLIVVVICAAVYTVIFILDRQLSFEMGLPLWLTILCWAVAAWLVLLLCLMEYTKIFGRLTTVFDQAEITILEETVKVKKNTHINYNSILEIEYGKLSVIKVSIGVFIGRFSDRVGVMRIKYTELQHIENGSPIKVFDLSIPYSKVKAVMREFNLNIIFIKDRFSFQ
ncbi:MAG: hypothetical protein FWE84_00700 [Firmicutes bacterium]|nr:hypothetical protein [Bacillota bacterium]